MKTVDQDRINVKGTLCSVAKCCKIIFIDKIYYGCILIKSGNLDKLIAPLYKCAKGWFGFVNEPVAFLARAFCFWEA
jgi:hypothetical protein